jgi:hypothetical protein
MITKSTILVTAVVTTILAIAAGLVAPAAAVSAAHRAMPSHGAVFNIGSKHAVSYFTADGGACNVTVMMGDKANDEGEGASVGTRMSFTVDAKRTARADTPDGQSLEFTCAKDAATMDVRPVERLAYVTPQK